MEAWYVAKTKASDMLSSPGMEALLEKVKQICDAVIVDSAPVIGCADIRILAKEMDKALLVPQPGSIEARSNEGQQAGVGGHGGANGGIALDKVKVLKNVSGLQIK